MALKRVSKERKYWTEALHETVKGFSDDEIARLLVRYAREINFEDVSDEEKQFFLFAQGMVEAGYEGRALTQRVKEFL